MCFEGLIVRLTLRVVAVVALLQLSTLALGQSSADKRAKDSISSNQAVAQRELSRIAEVIVALEKDMRSGQANRTQASRDLETHERAIAQIIREQNTLTATADKLTAQLQRLRVTREAVSAQVEQERKGLAGELRVAYAMGRGDRARLLLQRRDPSAIARLLRYHSYFSRAQRERIVVLERSVIRLSDTEQAIADETLRLAMVHERYRAKLKAFEHERNLRSTALAALNAELATSRSSVERLKKDRQRLTALISRLQEAIDDVPAEAEPPRSFETLRGKLPWPVSGELQHHFGAFDDEAKLTMQGVLVKAPMGHRVRAIAHGRVIFADWLRGFGLMVIVDHGGGYMSLYGNNQSLQREPGEWVSVGDSVATVGDSGGKDGAGLYFEIRHHGRPVNPVKWCSRSASFPAMS